MASLNIGSRAFPNRTSELRVRASLLVNSPLAAQTVVAHISPIEFGRTTWPRRAPPRRTDDLPPNLERTGCADVQPHYTRTCKTCHIMKGTEKWVYGHIGYVILQPY